MDTNVITDRGDEYALALGARLRQAQQRCQATAGFTTAPERTAALIMAQGGPRAMRWALTAIDELRAAHEALRTAIADAGRNVEAWKHRMEELEARSRPLPGSTAERNLSCEVTEAERAIEAARRAQFRLEDALHRAGGSDIQRLVEQATAGQRLLLSTAVSLELQATSQSGDLAEELRLGRTYIRHALARLHAAIDYRREVEQVVGPVTLLSEVTIADLAELEAVAQHNHLPELRLVRNTAESAAGTASTHPVR